MARMKAASLVSLGMGVASPFIVVNATHLVTQDTTTRYVADFKEIEFNQLPGGASLLGFRSQGFGLLSNATREGSFWSILTQRKDSYHQWI